MAEITTVYCKECKKPFSVIRSYYWRGKNKGKIQPVSNLLLCPHCGENATGEFIN